MKNVLIAVVIIAVVGLGIAYATRSNQNRPVTEGIVSSQSSSSSAVPSVPPSVSATQGNPVPASPSVTAPSVITVNMEAGSYYYKPNVITVKKGETVRLALHAVSMMHNFNIDALNVHSQNVQAGNTITFEFTPEKAGEFEFYCSVANHRSLGQVGKLIVQ